MHRFRPGQRLLARVRRTFSGASSPRPRELEAIEAISNALGRAGDAEEVARVLLDEIAELLDVEFAGLALVDEAQTEARGLLARRSGEDFDYWRELRFDLAAEASGIASAVFEAAPVAVYDVATSPQINQSVAEAVGARSAAFVPLVSGERVIAVLAIATTADRRSFGTAELGPLRALAAEATLALDRARSARRLEDALERERLVARIARRVRSELDLETVQRVAVEETGRALGVDRCFIRLGEPGGPMPIAAEWWRGGFEPIGEDASGLPVANLAARRRDTVAIGDVEGATELADPELGSVEALLALGTRAVVATPIAVFDRIIGVFALHRARPGDWSESDVALAEAVARELGHAIHTARLLQENQRRLDQQAALLNAAQVLTSELRLETVLQLLVDQLAQLLVADGADCYLLDPERSVLRCAAVHGLDEGIVGFEFPPHRGLAGNAIAEGTPVTGADYPSLHEPVPHDAYEGFASAVVAPMTWSGEIRGVLGVGSRDPERTFTSADVELLTGFASLASLALRNAEMFEARGRQARIESGFSQIASVLGESVSLEATLDAVGQAATDVLGGSFAAVLMPGPRGLELAGAYRLPRRLASELRMGLPEGGEVLAESAAAGRMLAASRLEDDERFGGRWRGLLAELGCASLLAAPLVVARGDGGGLVLVLFEQPKEFSDDDVALAGQLAGAARGALERSELFETERRARALSQQLARIGGLLTAELDPAAVLDEVVEQLPILLQADGASVRALEGEELVARAAAGAGREIALGTVVPAGARPSADIVQTRAPLALADVTGDERLLEGEPMLGAGYAGYLGVPLHGADGELYGVLAAYSLAPRSWREEEIEALSALAANASTALSNAELYQRVLVEQERSVAILRNVADGIVAVDRAGTVVLWNEAAERITGVPPDEALGRTVAQVLQRDLGSESAQQGERRVAIRRGSEEVQLSLTEAVMRDPAGEVAGRVFAFRDISNEHLVEQMKSDFVATVSHELRTPLTSIYGFAETLLRQDVLFSEDERRTFLIYVATEAERLTAIVDQLLAVARLDAGDLEVRPAPTDVRAIVAEVVSAAEQAPGLNGHRFMVELPRQPVAAQADPEKLRQILFNLVDNAVKFSPDGGTVRVGAAVADEAVEVTVADEGIGIPQSELPQIFKKFYRADSAIRRGQVSGTGLGLFIAQGLVEAMDGQIRVASSEGEGSTFVIELPAAMALAVEEQEVVH